MSLKLLVTIVVVAVAAGGFASLVALVFAWGVRTGAATAESAVRGLQNLIAERDMHARLADLVAFLSAMRESKDSIDALAVAVTTADRIATRAARLFAIVGGLLGLLAAVLDNIITAAWWPHGPKASSWRPPPDSIAKAVLAGAVMVVAGIIVAFALTPLITHRRPKLPKRLKRQRSHGAPAQ
jgi:hypothetical protein